MRARFGATRVVAVLAAAAALGAGLAAAPATAGALEAGVGADNSNDYPTLRSTDFVRIRFGGVNSPYGGAMGVEPGLSHASLNGGTSYAPCKGAPTAVPNVEDPINGGEPYKAACENTIEPSYYRSGLFGPGLRKRVPRFASGITVGNFDQTQACIAVCTHQWANRLTRFDVEIYLKKKDNATGRVVTDFEYVRPRFTVSAFPHQRPGGVLESDDFGVVSPLKAYQRGAARLQGLIFAKGSTRAPAGRVRFSMFENDANGRTSTGQPLQAFAVFTSTGAYYSTGTVYVGSYKLRLRDIETNRCVVLKHLPLPSMGQRVDIRLDRPGFGIPRARNVAC